MRANCHARLDRSLDGLSDRLRIAGMEPAGDIGGGHMGKNVTIGAQSINSEALTEIAIQIN